jgi:hypothetical protein
MINSAVARVRLICNVHVSHLSSRSLTGARMPFQSVLSPTSVTLPLTGSTSGMTVLIAPIACRNYNFI